MAITDKYVTQDGAGSGDGSNEANALSWAAMVTQINGGSAAGTRYNLKGNVSRSATDTISGSGSSTSPVIIRGYASAPGDGYQGRTNGNGPLVLASMPTISYSAGNRLNCTGTWLILETLRYVANYAGAGLGLASTSLVRSCALENASTNGSAHAVVLTGDTILFDCDVSMTGASGALCAVNSSNGRTIACRINAGPTRGVYVSNTHDLVAFNTIYAGRGSHVYVAATGAAPPILCNTLVDAQAGGTNAGIEVVNANNTLQCMIGNQLTDQTGYGINGVAATNAIFAAYNRLTRNTSGPTNLATDWLAATSYGHVTGAQAGADAAAQRAAEYVGPDSQDYRLQAAALGKGAGMPAALDTGALQRQEPVLPATADVWNGVQYGDGGTQYTGAKRASSIANCAAGNIKADVAIDDVTGSRTEPLEAQVRTGVQYGAGGTELTGTLPDPPADEEVAAATWSYGNRTLTE